MTAENRAAIRNLPNLLPGRFIDTGITEQTMVGAAAGLALRGRVPVLHALATFLTLRAFEFVRSDVGIGNLPVKRVANIQVSNYVPPATGGAAASGGPGAAAADYVTERTDTAAFTTAGTALGGSFPTAKVVGGGGLAGDAYTGGAAPPGPDPHPTGSGGPGSPPSAPPAPLGAALPAPRRVCPGQARQLYRLKTWGRGTTTGTSWRSASTSSRSTQPRN